MPSGRNHRRSVCERYPPPPTALPPGRWERGCYAATLSTTVMTTLVFCILSAIRKVVGTGRRGKGVKGTKTTGVVHTGTSVTAALFDRRRAIRRDPVGAKKGGVGVLRLDREVIPRTALWLSFGAPKVRLRHVLARRISWTRSGGAVLKVISDTSRLRRIFGWDPERDLLAPTLHLDGPKW
jgi:hypothetical protein